ncbi:Hypothetical protein PHPALM_6321, partial [Phytophthora palmivora]
DGALQVVAGNTPAADSKEAPPSDTLVDKSETKEVKQVQLSGAASKSSGADMCEADSKASADAAACDTDLESKAPEVNQKDAPEFKTPRHATLEDVRGLILSGMLRQEEVDLPDFLVPECPPHWKLLDPPNLKTNAYLVGVPGIVNDIRAGAFAMEGYGGVEELSDDDLQELKEICGVRGGMASLLRHFNSTRFAERVFKTTGYLRQVLGAYKSMRSLAVAQQGPIAIQQAVDVRRKNKELKRSWKFTCDYWFLELQEALGKLDSAESEHKSRLADSEAQEHTDFTGNWERLHDLFKLCVKDTKPPESWDTVVNVAAMDKRKAAVAPYPEKSQHIPPSSGSDSTNRPEVLVLTGTGSNSQSGSGAGNEAQGSAGSLDSKKNSGSRKSQNSGMSGKQLPSTHSKVRKVQRRPKDHQPGRDSVRRAGEKTVVSKEAAHSMLPGGVVWKEIRPAVRQAILAGLNYDTAMECIGNDRAPHGHFRQPQLVKMFVGMMYWCRLDKTPWSKYVPEAYYEMADERLDRRLRRGDVPAPWGILDDHVVYPDKDADSTVDDVENDPEYQPPTQEPEEGSSSSSSEDEDEEVVPEILDEDENTESDDCVEAKETLESKPPAKRPRSVSNEKPQGSNPKPKKQRRKATRKTLLLLKVPLTVDDLQTAEDPENDETSWRIYGVLVQYPSSTKRASCQTPGFPEYEIHKYSYDVVHDRWNRSHPGFYFHKRDILYAKALKLVEDIVDVMHKQAQAIWERGHWVPIPTEEKADIVFDSQRNRASGNFQTNAATGFGRIPGPRSSGGPPCKNLDLQLATLDMREPARVQWSTAIDDEEWLQFVSDNVKRHVKPGSIRKLNPLSLTYS